MARRINPDELPFEIPKFDEDEFVRKELISFKTTAALFVYTLVVAFATFLAWRSTGVRFLPLLLLAALLGVVLKPLYKILRIDISHWKRKEWIGTYLLYFLFWLGFTLLIFNPPFSDTAAPSIQIAVVPGAQGEGFPIEFHGVFVDNRNLVEDSVLFCIVRVDGAPPASYEALSAEEQAACRVEWAPGPDGAWRHTWGPDRTADAAGSYVWFAEAEDAAGHRATANGSFTIGTAFDVFPPGAKDGVPTFDDITRRLIVQPRADLDLRAVQYAFGNESGPESTWYNMVRDPERGRWSTSPEYPGWSYGENVVTVRALEHTRFLLDTVRVEPGAAYREDATYTIVVETGLPLGTESQPTYEPRREPQRVGAPGIELPLTVLGIVGVAFLAGRRR